MRKRRQNPLSGLEGCLSDAQGTGQRHEELFSQGSNSGPQPLFLGSARGRVSWKRKILRVEHHRQNGTQQWVSMKFKMLRTSLCGRITPTFQEIEPSEVIPAIPCLPVEEVQDPALWEESESAVFPSPL
jgi:hypothetical protein